MTSTTDTKGKKLLRVAKVLRPLDRSSVATGLASDDVDAPPRTRKDSIGNYGTGFPT